MTTSTILVVLGAVAVIGAIVYFFFLDRSDETTTSSTPSTNTGTPSTSQPPTNNNPDPLDQYSTMSKKELLALARQRGLKVNTRMKKLELIDILMSGNERAES